MEPKQKNLITDLEVWRDQFRSYLDVFLDAFCIVDTNNTVVEYNIAFAELVGESHRKIRKIGLLGKLIAFEGRKDPFEMVFKNKAPIRIDEIKASSKAHLDLTLIVGAVPIFSNEGAIIGALITLRNVTAEHALLLKYDEKKRDSVTDGLTSMFNKRFMEESITKFIKISLREGKPFSFVILDIDFFKKVNDTHGHPAGDYVLKLVASNLKSMLRETDLAGRFGGEEFVVLLANCPVSGAAVFAERLRRSIESTLFIFEGKRIPITISQGTATLESAWRDGLDPEVLKTELFHCADQALYQAKATGRNRVCQHKGKIGTPPSESGKD
jgi:diguanylate cyclase (GGDEF)-like protein